MNNLIPHLIEFRRRVIFCTFFVFTLFIGLFAIDEHLYTMIARPLLAELPAGNTMIATEVMTPFMVPMKLAWITAIFCAVPVLSYQLWAFIAPGLYPNEKQTVLPFLIGSLVLFYGGVFFSYTVICPMALGFFAKSAPANVMVMTDIKAYLDFVLTVLLAGGLAFQVPIVTLTVVKANLVSIEQLEYLRPYIIVAAFVLGMLLTPPDVVSQILLALPMWGLFEAGLLTAKYLKKKPSTNNAL